MDSLPDISSLKKSEIKKISVKILRQICINKGFDTQGLHKEELLQCLGIEKSKGIPKIKGAFTSFCADERSRYNLMFPELSSKDITKKISEKWMILKESEDPIYYHYIEEYNKENLKRSTKVKKFNDIISQCPSKPSNFFIYWKQHREKSDEEKQMSLSEYSKYLSKLWKQEEKYIIKKWKFQYQKDISEQQQKYDQYSNWKKYITPIIKEIFIDDTITTRHNIIKLLWLKSKNKNNISNKEIKKISNKYKKFLSYKTKF